MKLGFLFLLFPLALHAQKAPPKPYTLALFSPDSIWEFEGVLKRVTYKRLTPTGKASTQGSVTLSYKWDSTYFPPYPVIITGIWKRPRQKDIVAIRRVPTLKGKCYIGSPFLKSMVYIIVDVPRGTNSRYATYCTNGIDTIRVDTLKR